MYYYAFFNSIVWILLLGINRQFSTPCTDDIVAMWFKKHLLLRTETNGITNILFCLFLSISLHQTPFSNNHGKLLKISFHFVYIFTENIFFVCTNENSNPKQCLNKNGSWLEFITLILNFFPFDVRITSRIKRLEYVFFFLY